MMGEVVWFIRPQPQRAPQAPSQATMSRTRTKGLCLLLGLVLLVPCPLWALAFMGLAVAL